MEFDSELDSDEEDITADMLELSIQGVEPLTHDKSTQREDSTYLKKQYCYLNYNVFRSKRSENEKF